MSNNSKRAVAITAFLFLYAFGLPIMKLCGLLDSMSWTIAFLPLILPWLVVLAVVVLSVPFFTYMLVVEWMNGLFPDKQNKA